MVEGWNWVLMASGSDLCMFFTFFILTICLYELLSILPLRAGVWVLIASFPNHRIFCHHIKLI